MKQFLLLWIVVCWICQLAVGQVTSLPASNVFYDMKVAEGRPLAVKKLDVSRQGLKTIPASITNFRNLSSLNLSGNDLEVLPSFFSSLVNLKELNLSHMPTLKATQLFDNIKSLRNLRSLNLESGTFVILPYEVTELKNLEYINLHNNLFDELPTFVLELTELKSLNLSNNKLEKLDYGIYKLQNLKEIDLSFNEKLDYGDAMFTLSYMTNLEKVSIRGLKEVPEELNKLQQVKYLDLSRGEFDRIPIKMKDLNSLEHLNLNYCNKLNMDEGLPKLGSLTQLKKLEILSDKTYFLPKGVGKFVNLEELSIGGRVWKLLSPDTKKLVRLKSLVVSNSPLMDIRDLVDKLVDINTLSSLSLKLCDLKEFPMEIFKLKKLENVDLRGNFITTLPDEIANMKNLKKLDLRGNQIHQSEILRFVNQLPNCEILYNKTSPKKRFAAIEPPVKTVKVEPTTYKIHKSATGFQHPSGTKVVIPKDAFLHLNGQSVAGNVEVHYREFFNPLDIWSSGVPMTVDSVGNQYDLKTAGIIEFEATSQGKQLKANPAVPITIEMLSPLSDDDIYDIHYYNLATSKWQFAGRDKILGKEKASNTGNANDPFAGGFMNTKVPVMPTRPVPPEVEELDVSFLGKKRKKTVSFKGQYYDDQNTRKVGWGTKFFNDLDVVENVAWLYDGKYWRSDSKMLDTLSRINAQIKAAEADRSVLDDMNISFAELSAKKTLDVLLEPGKEEGKFILKFIRAIDTIIIPVKSNQIPSEKTEAEKFFTDYINLRAERSENWDKVDNDYKENLKKYEQAVDQYRVDLSNYSNDIGPLGGMVQNGNDKIRRRVSLSKFGIFSVNKIQLRDTENLTTQYVDGSGNVYEAQRVYVLDETNNSVIVNAGNQLSYDPHSKNTIIAVLDNGDLGVINSGAFRRMKKKIKEGNTLLKLEVLPKESLTMLRLKHVLSLY